MIKRAINALATPILMDHCLRKHKSIWGLKSHLCQTSAKNAKLHQLYDLYFKKYGSWIGYSSNLEDIPNFPHQYFGIFISGQSVIGRNAVIFQQVTIGSNSLGRRKTPGAPIIGDNVYIGAGAKIIGDISIGDNCRIGANAVVYNDMPSNSVAVQAHTRIIQKRNLDNRYYFKINNKWHYMKNNSWILDDAD